MSDFDGKGCHDYFLNLNGYEQTAKTGSIPVFLRDVNQAVY